MIACFLSNISAKYYKNPSMLSRVIAENVGDVFLRHSVVAELLIYTVSENIPDVFSYNSRKHCRIFIIFGRNITKKACN